MKEILTAIHYWLSMLYRLFCLLEHHCNNVAPVKYCSMFVLQDSHTLNVYTLNMILWDSLWCILFVSVMRISPTETGEKIDKQQY